MRAATDLSPHVGHAAACRAFGVARASFYRRRKTRDPKPVCTRARPVRRRLTTEERGMILETLNAERFVDSSPAQVYATLLDEGMYLCSISTMYRILRDARQIRERRNQLSRPNYTRPELLATAPKQVWSWDITKLRGPSKWMFFQLYVILERLQSLCRGLAGGRSRE